jgi:hypothetical protein
MLRNDIAFYLARQTGAWAPNGKPVELVLNGVHVGNYYLCEQIKIDENRLNIVDKKVSKLSAQTEAAAGAELGYLLECDKAADETEIYFRVTSPVPFYVYIKDPGDAESGTVGYSYIQNYFNQIGTAINEKNWDTVSSLIDYQSFADHWIFSEITENQESKHPKSFYMNKDAGKLLKAGPAWDYDWGTFIEQSKIGNSAHGETSSTAGSIMNGYTMRYTMWYQYLFNDPDFVAVVKERWVALKSNFYTSLTYLDQRAALVKRSDVYNHAMWPIEGMIAGPTYRYGFPNLDEQLSHDDAIARMRANIEARIEWLDAEINKM